MCGFNHVCGLLGRHDGVKSGDDAVKSCVVLVRAAVLVAGRVRVESLNVKNNPLYSGAVFINRLVDAVNVCGVGRGRGADRVNNAALGGVKSGGDCVHAVGGGVPGGKVGGGFLAFRSELRGAAFQVLAFEVNTII